MNGTKNIISTVQAILFILLTITLTYIMIHRSQLFSEIVFLLKFFGGLILLFGIGYLLGKLLKIDKYRYKSKIK